jgi:uncharacterized membrane protein YebE (DUF533 family)
MSMQGLLDQLLKTGASALGDVRKAAPADLNKYATGAAVGGVLGLLLGTRSGRSLGGKALKFGSVAALGALAWKAWQEHQADQRAAAPAAAAGAPTGQPASFQALPPPQQEQRSRAMLKAMIAAAKSDGHLDERERGLVQDELRRMDADEATQRWFDAELGRPVDPADVAAAISTPQQAAEIYLASLIVVDETTPMERAYLDELARHLKLDPALKADLEQRASAAA